MVSQLKSSKKYLLSRDRLTTRLIPLSKHQFEFCSPINFRGQEMKARNNPNLKNRTIANGFDLYDTTRRSIE